jgi:hypothetical protein
MSRSLPPDAAALLQLQHGVATAAQLRTAGMTKRQLGVAVNRGLLLNPRRGVYVGRSTWRAASDLTRHAMRLLAVQLVAPDAVGIDLTAAMVWQIPVRHPPGRPFIARHPEHGLVAGAHVTRVRWAAHDVVSVEGLRVTSLASTAVSVAAHSDTLADALITMDAALRRGVDASDLLRCVHELPSASQQQRARHAIEHADPWSESWLESLSRGRAIELDMPVPLCNVTVICEGREARVDDLWAEVGVVGEADGKGKYERRMRPAAEVHWEEKQRREWLDEIGFEVARWGTREVAVDGRAMKRRVDRAITRQAQVGFRWPSGVRAELRSLAGVTPPDRVAAEIARLRSLGFPICIAEPEWWRPPMDPGSLWTPADSVEASQSSPTKSHMKP